MGLVVLGVQLAHVASLLPAWRRFRSALRDPERVQGELLSRILRANQRTAYGLEHRFEAVDSPHAYQGAVPIADYEAHAPWIERVAAGEQGVLTAEPVVAMERTSGSTAGGKLIPYTRGLLDDFAAATAPWIASLFPVFPRLAGTRSYWSISPAARTKERTAGGIPIGFEDDTEYFGPLTRWGLRRMMAVPGTVARIAEVDRWRGETIRRLVAARDLGLISVWNPSFLTLLMDAIAREHGGLTPVRRAIDAQGKLTGEALWPRLAMISCWTDAGAAAFLPALRAYFPETPIQPKGLLATEGVVSVPYADRGACLAVSSHFLELADLDRPPGASPVLVHEARAGGAYSPLLTTRGGLYRYPLGDVVRVTGFLGRTPIVRFEGKLDGTSDVCGEKLTEAEVARAIAQARELSGAPLRFALVAPVMGSPPRYELYVDTDSDDAGVARLRDSVEAHLAGGHHYAYCRDLGQLGPLSVVRVHDGARRYQDTQARSGARVGSIKPLCLDKRPIWREIFEVNA